VSHNNSYEDSSVLLTLGAKSYKFSDIFGEIKATSASEMCAGKNCIVDCSCKSGWSPTKPSSGGYVEVKSPRAYALAGSEASFSSARSYSTSNPQKKSCYKKVTCEDYGYYSEKPQYYPDCSITTVNLGSVKMNCYRDCYGYFYLHRTYYTNKSQKKESSFNNDAAATTCGTNQILVGRYHSGDENKNSQLRCGTFHVHPTENTSVGDCYSGIYGINVTVEGRYWTDWKTERYNYFSAPYGYVITGREHSGDERGNTRYEVGKIYVSNGKNKTAATLYDSKQTPECKESSCGWVGVNGPNMMTGRDHGKDENSKTTYKYHKAKVYLKYD